MKQTRIFIALIVLLALPAFACNLTAQPEPTPTPTATAPPPTTTQPPPTETPSPPTPVPTPTETPDPLADFIRYETEALGFALQYPESWFASEDDEKLTLVSDVEMLDDEDFSMGAGVILAGNADLGLLSPAAILEMFVAPEAGLLTDAVVVVEPREVLIQGQQALQATYDADLEGQPVRARLTVIVQGPMAVVAVALTPAGGSQAQEPVLEAIVNSIEVIGPPAPEAEGQIRVGQSASGSIPINGSAEWTFTIADGESVNVIVEPDDELDAVLDVRDAAGVSVLVGGAIDQSFDQEETGDLILPAGTYSIYISGFGSSSGAYTLRLIAGTASLEGTAIRPGDSLAGAIEESSPRAYTFSALAGEEYAFTVTPDGDLDVVLTLLTATGTELEEQDNSFGEELYYFYPPTDGDYKLIVSSFDSSDGTYTIALSQNPASSGSGLDLPLVPEDGVFVEETRALASEETASYFVPGLEFSPLTIVVTPEEEFDVVVEVFDSSGTLLLSQDRAFDYEEVIFIPERDDEYEVVISGYEDSAGIYDLAIFRGGVGGVGFLGSVIVATDTLADGEDTFAYPFFTLGSEPVVALLYPLEQFDAVIDVVDDDTDETIRSVDANTGYERLLFLPPEDGNYFFDVYGFEGQSGSYDIYLLGGPDVFFELAIGDLIYGNLGEDGALFYTYRGLAGETISASAVPTSGLDLVVEIGPLEGEPYVTADLGLEGEGETAAFTLPEDEIVLIVVRGFAGATGRFTMTLDAP